VKLSGELWKARCEGGCDTGTEVVVRDVDGLTLVVEPISS
jgi:membrane protein implicated in regulation of membrane protease activity